MIKKNSKFSFDIYIDVSLYIIFLTYILINFDLSIANFIVLTLTLITLGFWIISRVKLGSSFSVLPEAKQLVTKGIYSKIRNPIYLFTIIANIGIIYLLNNKYLYLIVPVILIIQIIRIKREEKVLIKIYGDRYLEYKKDTWF